MRDDERVLSEEEARRLWARAAELQAEAAQRLEERSRALAQGEDSAGGGAYRLIHVRQAAQEAGISPEFVELALAESEDGRAPATRSDRWADRFLGQGPRALVASRRFDHPVAEVYGAMQRVFPRYRLSLVDSRGGDPLGGGVLVFELPSLSGMETTDQILKDLHFWADVRELHVSLRALDDERSEMTIRAPLGYARKLNLWVGGVLAGAVGIVGALIAMGIAAPLVVMLGLGAVGEGAAIALAAAAGLGTGAGGGTAGMRKLYGWATTKGISGLERLLQALAVDLRTGGAFQPPPPAPGSLPPGSTGSGPLIGPR